MVRVLACHNFESQHVFASSGEPVAMCCSNSSVFIATAQQYVEVRNIRDPAEIIHTFPTVATVRKVQHSVVGNYIATLEVKNVKQASLTFVRVYLHWQLAAKEQSMKVRVAGHADTQYCRQSSQPTEDKFEVVELPLKVSPTCLACCLETGNLVVGVQQTCRIYKLIDMTDGFSGADQETSVEIGCSVYDLQHLCTVTFNFPVRETVLCEEYLAALSLFEVHIIKLDVYTRSSGTNQKVATFHGPFYCSEEQSSKYKDFLVQDKNFAAWDFSEEPSIIQPPQSTKNKRTAPSMPPATVVLPGIVEDNRFSEGSRDPVEMCGAVKKLTRSDAKKSCCKLNCVPCCTGAFLHHSWRGLCIPCKCCPSEKRKKQVTRSLNSNPLPHCSPRSQPPWPA